MLFNDVCVGVLSIFWGQNKTERAAEERDKERHIEKQRQSVRDRKSEREDQEERQRGKGDRGGKLKERRRCERETKDRCNSEVERGERKEEKKRGERRGEKGERGNKKKGVDLGGVASFTISGDSISWYFVR